MNSDTSILKKLSIVFAIAGLLGGVLFTACHGYQLGYEPKHFQWSFNAFQPIPDYIEFPHSYLSPYVLVALAALLSCSRQAAWTSLISTLLILYVGGATYQTLLRSGVPSINDITHVNLPIQGYLAWIALFTAGWGLVSRLKGMLTQKPRALQSPAQSSS